MKKRALLIAGVALVLTLSTSFLSFAAEWKQEGSNWWYQEDNGVSPFNQWKWIDGNGDGIAELYYFDSNGYVATNTTVGNHTLNADGAWTVDGIVQTQNVSDVSIAGIIGKPGFIKQEYLDVMGKDKDYVFSVFGNTDEEYTDTYTYTMENGDLLELILYDNKLTDLTYYMNGEKPASDQQMIAEIESQLSIPAIKREYSGEGITEDFVLYEWRIGSNPSLRITYSDNGYYSLYWNTYP